MPFLVDQFLLWKEKGPPEEDSSDPIAWEMETISFSRKFLIIDLWLKVLTFFLELQPQTFRHIPDASYINQTLVRNGFLGASPEKPTLAISIELLEIYRQLRRVCPRFSLDALARALCHIHKVSSVSKSRHFIY